MSAFVYQGNTLDPFDLHPTDSWFMQEALFLFGILVAGKSARIAWPKAKAILEEVAEHDLGGARVSTPFTYLHFLQERGELDAMLLRHKTGQYQRIGPAFKACARLSRSIWGFRCLQQVPGVGLKTAKLVQLYAEPCDLGRENGGQCACLDVHVLRAMKTWSCVKKLGLKVPDASPQDPFQYGVLEFVFMREAERLGLKPWELDKKLWKAAAKKEN